MITKEPEPELALTLEGWRRLRQQEAAAADQEVGTTPGPISTNHEGRPR